MQPLRYIGLVLTKIYKYRGSVLVLALLFALASCSVKKNTFVSRNFHQLTTHYNGWFYTDEIINTAVDKMQAGSKDNYNKILPLYVYGSIEDGKAMTPDMEKAFKKISTCIQKHSMLINDKQHNAWIYDCYLLVGKTHFYKHDFFAGLEAFEYVSARNKNKPVQFEAMLWMLRTYNETGLFSSSQGLIDLMAEKKSIPRKFLKDYYGLIADYHIKIKNYAQAEKALSKAIPLMRRGKQKARFYYVLAQLYKKTGQASFAATCFSRAMKMTPNNEMQFQAKMNLAGSLTAGGNTKDVKKLLLKMLNSAKYSDFKDQLYFALSQVNHAEGDITTEITSLKASVKYSQKNKNQRGMSSLALANLLFDQGIYPLSENYYDTALTALPEDYEDLGLIRNKKKNLSTLVKYMKTIQQSDSLIRLGKMSESERNAFVDKMIAELKKKEEKALEEAENAKNNSSGIFTPTSSDNSAPAGTWYFYNPAALSLGYTEFIKKFGNRKLEDNWRRSNKPAVAPEEQTPGSPDKGTAAETKTGSAGSKEEAPNFSSVKSREEYLKNVPVSAGDQAKSLSEVKSALYNIGLIYREQLGDNKHAAESFEKLIERFPGDSLECLCYYYLHRIYSQMANDAGAEKYKNLILSKYASSEYAELIKNPEYNSEREYKLNAANRFYQSTFEFFETGNYDSCYARCVLADSLFSRSENTPKYALLKAMCLGKISGKEEMLFGLKKVTVDFASHPVKARAQEIIDLLQGTTEAPKDTTKAEKYLDPGNGTQYFILVIPVTADLVLAKTKVSEFNTTYYESSSLLIQDILLGKSYKLVVVKEFADRQKAITYYSTIKDQASVLQGINPKDAYLMLITPDNYKIFFKEQNPGEYRSFFERKYLKNL